MKKEDDSKPKDHRVLGLVTIGWTSIALFIFTIPIAAILKDAQPILSSLLPFTVVGGAIASGILMWSKGGPPEKAEPLPSDQVAQLQETIDQLEERLRSVEAINSYEHKMAEKNWTGRIVVDTRESEGEEATSSKSIR